MLSLKDLLINAGAVTEEQARAHTTNEKLKRSNPYVKKLLSLNKGEQYALIRSWVSRNRLDKRTLSSEESVEKFFFTNTSEQPVSLTIETSVVGKLKSGEACIMAYMSHQGLAHCIIPEEIAKDVAVIFPEWIRYGKNF